MNKQDYLFNKGVLRNMLTEREKALFNEIDSQHKDYILKVNINEFTNYLFERYVLTPIILKEKNIETENNEIEIDVSKDPRRLILDEDKPCLVKATQVTFHIPFEGDNFLFNYQSSQFCYGKPKGEIRDNELIIKLITLEHDASVLKREFDTTLAEIKKWLKWIDDDITPFNKTLKQKIEVRIKSRQEKLRKDAELVSSLGFPLKIRKDAPNMYALPDMRKKLIMQKPAVSKEKIKPEWALSLSDYDIVLRTIEDMAIVMERSPNAFKTMDEETIRFLFLIPLNGLCEGQATGETFNYDGKTDILIRIDGKNVFIAECKFWKGKEGLIETIDQILGYLSWRDTKTAIILFNKNKDLSKVLAQIPDIVNKHPNFKRQEEYKSETGFRFIFHHNDDKARELYLTILVFEVPQ